MGHLDETFIGRQIYSPAMAKNLKKTFSRYKIFLAFLNRKKNQRFLNYHKTFKDIKKMR